MNPEEGDIRPQLLDRFGLCVEIHGEKDLATRTKIVERRLAFDSDPGGLTEAYAEETQRIKDSISGGRKILSETVPDKELIALASHVALHFEMEGHRADITMVRAAMANAALDGRDAANKEDVATVAPMVLTHRIKRKPFEESKFDIGELRICLQEF